MKNMKIANLVVGVGFLAGALLSVVRGEVVYWTGGSGTWTDASRWTNAFGINKVPDDGDDVVVGSGTVLLSSATAELSSFTMTGGQVVFSNWTTRLQADDVHIASTNAVLTLPPAFNNVPGDPSNRIHVVCQNLTFNGQIQANGRGFRSTQGPGAGGNGGVNQSAGGGGHGGRGGAGNAGAGGITNDWAHMPMAPGSGGGTGNNGTAAGGAGGGVVIIEASGLVTINNLIDASGANSSYIAYPGGGGAGGTIFITANVLSGSSNGLLRARGGNSGLPATSSAGGGGGGRIALQYNLVSNANFRFDVAGGTGNVARAAGAMGTIYLPDTALLSDTLHRFESGRIVIPGFTNWSLAGMTLSNRVVGLEAADLSSFRLDVSGNLTIFGGGLNIGGVPVTRGVSDIFDGGSSISNPVVTVGGRLDVLSGGSLVLGLSGTDSSPVLSADGDVRIEGSNSSVIVGNTNRPPQPQVTIGGNLILGNGGVLRVHAGATNGLSWESGGLVTIAGTLAITSNAWIYPVSHWSNGGAVRFRAGRLVVGEGSGLNADSGGYGWALGPGKGGNAPVNRSSGGGGYGGKGGHGSGGAGGTPYGKEGFPLLPGSGGGTANGGNVRGGIGGGAVWVEVQGEAILDGMITANGGDGQLASYGGGGGSGGGIFLTCTSLRGDLAGILRAKGGNGLGSTNLGGGGGGGRIAVWIGTSESERMAYDAGNTNRVQKQGTWERFFGTITVSEGTGRNSPPDIAEPGTAWFFVGPPRGTVIQIR